MAKVGIVMGSDSDMPVMAQAADILNTKRLKSDNIALGSVIPLPDGKKGVIVKEVELCSFREKL